MFAVPSTVRLVLLFSPRPRGPHVSFHSFQLARMNPEEYSQFINSLETHYEEFKRSCQGSQMFAENDKRGIESQFNAAQAYYGTLVVQQLPIYRESRMLVQVNAYILGKMEHGVFYSACFTCWTQLHLNSSLFFGFLFFI